MTHYKKDIYSKCLHLTHAMLPNIYHTQSVDQHKIACTVCKEILTSKTFDEFRLQQILAIY